MTRGGSSKPKDGPERRCLVTRESAPKSGLVRFVIDPVGAVVPDVLGKLPGRGYYITAQRDVLETAIKRNAFSGGKKKGQTPTVTIGDGLIDEIERQLAARVVGLIAMARKAGLAQAGFERVKAALAAGDVKVLLQARDGSERGKGKLWTPEGARWFGCLTADELGMAFGRGHVIHAALSAGGLTRRVVEEAAKLNGLRETDDASR